MQGKGNKKYEIGKARKLPLGVFATGNDLIFSLPVEENLTNVVFYSKSTGRKVADVEVNEEYRSGNVYSFLVKGASANYYMLYNDEKPVKNHYAGVVVKKSDFGKTAEYVYGVYEDDFLWDGDKKLRTPYEDSFIYRMHVRGFTKHQSSKVKNKGTFAGIIEKTDYLKSLGVTAVELMPAYEFDENIGGGKLDSMPLKVNYWGYGDAHYFAPKQSYSSVKKGGQIKEFKEFVLAMHKAGIEVIMDFYFVPDTNPYFIMDCLRYWVLEYHIDGFHLNMEVAPVKLIKEDPILSEIKILADTWDAADKSRCLEKRIAIFNDDFMINVRKFIKSDEGQVQSVAEKIKRNPSECGIINYVANHYTFSLMDAVSYDRKHNESNGENNSDGTEYNYSWNCGTEGPTRKKKIKELRLKQIKNAITMLFISQGTPMILAGDEMGRTCNGNNNPYCHDSEINWIDWQMVKGNNEILEFVIELVKFRKEHRVLHRNEEPKCMDFLSSGFPDVSFHGVEPWRADYTYGSRQLGILYNGAYGENESSIYIAMNMYWDELDFNIPNIDKNTSWKIKIATDKEIISDTRVVDRVIKIPGRSIVLLEKCAEE